MSKANKKPKRIDPIDTGNEPMGKVGLRRLRKLADYLEDNVKNTQFDLGIWSNNESYQQTKCGTVCCAFGWAGFSGIFKELTMDSTVPILRETHTVNLAGDQLYAMDAAAVFFGISVAQADYIFNPEYYTAVNPYIGTVIKRLRKFASDKGVIADKEWLRHFYDE